MVTFYTPGGYLYGVDMVGLEFVVFLLLLLLWVGSFRCTVILYIFDG